jgi:hypothetical protein
MDPGASSVKLWGGLPGARGAAENPRAEDVVEEEDFTDGIDDETFLMLCASQRPVPMQGDRTTHDTGRKADPPLLRQEPRDDARSKYHASMAAVTTEEGPATTGSSHLKQDLGHSNGSTKSAPRVQAAADHEPRRPPPPISKRASESFSAVFDEIEEDDLIALAGKVEANIAASRALSQGMEIRTTTPSPQPEPKPTTLRGALLGVDFGAGPGSFTQGLMLELVEKAEAAMVGHK